MDRLADWLRRLDIELFALAGTSFTLLSVLKVLLLLVVLVWLAGLVRRLTVERALRHTQLDAGTRQAVGSIVRYLVLVIGLVVILQNAGINLSALSVVAGAVGVGVGFGLQNIVSNFVAGVIIMLERPIKVGDRVEVAGVEGTVREIGARRTTIVTNDNIAILVPNQRFILDNVVNLVYTEAPIRLRVPVQVASDSDAAAVERLLLEAAQSHKQVLAEPAPRVLRPTLVGTALSFELSVWHEARGPLRHQLISELNVQIDQRLRASGIRYP
jgi:small-conductance mechanosensitive channel